LRQAGAPRTRRNVDHFANPDRDKKTVFQKSLDWFDDRTGYRGLLAVWSRRKLPRGPKWSYTIANCLIWLLVIEMVTGALMMCSYSPSTSSAWASVHYIEQSPCGSFIRGLHYWTAQVMIVLFSVHLVRVLLVSAFRRPHELVWVTGLLLPPALIVLAVTGNPLSGSQEGFAQIKVEGAIIASFRLVGPVIERLLIGGSEVGNLTLTHLYFLHVLAMPIVVCLLLAMHVQQLYRHGLPTQQPRAPSGGRDKEQPYWPHQTVRNMLVLTAVLGVVSYLAWSKGAPFFAPADPTLPHSPRPVWYFLSLYELRGWFPQAWDFIPTTVLPVVILLLLIAIPIFDRFMSRSVSRVFRLVVVLFGVAAAVGLTFFSLAKDFKDAEYQASVELNHWFGDRSRVLADRGQIPPIGAIALLRNDPKTQGPLIFKRHCVGCHSFAGPEDEENVFGRDMMAEKPSAPNLYGFGRQAWHEGWLDPERIKSGLYWGGTEFATEGEMIHQVADMHKEAKDKDKLRKDLRKIARALVAEAKLTSQIEADQQEADEIAEGRRLLMDEYGCSDCHGFDGELGSAPDLTGYGSRAWLKAIVSNPEHERFYPGNNDRMPAYAKNPSDPKSNLLSPLELNLLVDWLRGDWYEPNRKPEYAGPMRDGPTPAAATSREATSAPAAKPPQPDGPALFARHCAKCHSHADGEGIGIVAKKPSAPNLYAFGGLDWHKGWLDPDRIKTEHYFGNTAFAEGDMVEWITVDMFEDLDDDGKAKLQGQMVKIARALAAEARLPAYAQADQRDADLIDQGKELIAGEVDCTMCHKFHDGDLGDAPDLTAYGSVEWLAGIISNPEHKRFYPDSNDRMPAFASNPDAAEKNLLTPQELNVLVNWLRTAGHQPPAAE